ncbi:MAG: hypothetical protein CM15mP39_08140 [Synechococcus sp.]|nr:MAG: hypothetical protein CM15mP39_08140 [Synechococcus sp.]
MPALQSTPPETELILMRSSGGDGANQSDMQDRHTEVWSTSELLVTLCLSSASHHRRFQRASQCAKRRVSSINDEFTERLSVVKVNLHQISYQLLGVTRTQCGSSVICCYFGITSGFLLSKVVYVFFKCLCHSISISLKPSYSMRLAAAGRLREKISKMWPSLHPAFHDRGHNQEVFSETKWH